MLKLFLLHCLHSYTLAFPFFITVSPIAGGIGFIAYKIRYSVECLLRECCRDAYHFNATNLLRQLRTDLHGQHIAEERLYHHVKAHFEDPTPRKALVLSLHGFTGVGKNFASSIIVSNLLKLGERSRFYHFFDSTIHFPFNDLVTEYSIMLQSSIKRAVSECPRSIFVFDEVHKMPDGLLNSIVPFLGYSPSIDDVDYRRSVYIFLGNAGATVINEYVYNSISHGKKRTDIQYGDLRRALANSIFNEQGAFRYSNLISQHLITAVIPFLPLQEVHIRRCIADEAVRLGVEATDEMKDFVVEELDWGPAGTKMFSESGCKIIYEKVGLFLQQFSFALEKTEL